MHILLLFSAMVFCYQNCSNLLREKIVLVIGREFAKFLRSQEPEALAETIESDPLCISDLFWNKSVAYFQCGRKNIFRKI